MKICIISKYPPIEGGVSSHSYWFAKALGERGHKVFFITNALCVEQEYREFLEGNDLKFYQPKNVKVFNLDPFSDPFHIPKSKNYSASMTNMAVEAIEKYNVDLIDSYYLLPYGFSASVSSFFTKKPYMVRHAGSDITRLFDSPYLNEVLKKVILNSERLITIPQMFQKFKDIGVKEQKISFINNNSIDCNTFSPSKSGSLEEYGLKDFSFLITFLGKPSEYSGIFNLLRVCKKVRGDFKVFLVIGNKGKMVEKVKNEIIKFGLENKTLISDFLPPWKIPKIIASSDIVVKLENNFPVKIHDSILLKEIMASGTCPFISREIFEKNSCMDIEDGKDVIVVDIEDDNSFSMKIDEIIKRPEIADKIGKNSREKIEKISNFDGYIDENLSFYKKILEKL